MLYAGLLACVLSALQASDPARPPATEPAPPVARIAVIGASATAGFHAHVSLAEALDAQIAAPHAAPRDFSTESLFLDPGPLGEAQVESAAEMEPTLVVAADFLFWFGYGVAAKEETRLASLDKGLELLEKLKCPLILSRFPDMSPAVGKMLMSVQVPSKETLARLNARLESWAAKRGRVAFVPMAEFIEKLRAGDSFKAGELEFKGPEVKQRLMQRDELHPTAEGLGVLARLCAEAALEPSIGAKRADFKAELAPVLASLKTLAAGRALAEREGPGARQDPPKPEPGGKSDAPAPPRRAPAATIKRSRSRRRARRAAAGPRRFPAAAPSLSPSPS